MLFYYSEALVSFTLRGSGVEEEKAKKALSGWTAAPFAVLMKAHALLTKTTALRVSDRAAQSEHFPLN